MQQCRRRRGHGENGQYCRQHAGLDSGEAVTLTSHTLWIRTQDYVREQLPKGTPEKTVSDVATKVYDQMEFLLGPPEPIHVHNFKNGNCWCGDSAPDGGVARE